MAPRWCGKDLQERHSVKLLIDSAKYYYAKADFKKTYNCYDAASVFLGGMSNDENFEAAVIFSKIAERNQEQQYKSIALDFLNLLSLRNNLTKAQLHAEAAFKILYLEKRWLDMINDTVIN